MNYMDRLSGNHRADNAAGSGSTIVRAIAHSNGVSVSRPWAELAEFESAKREREMRSLGFGRRESLCG
jgi:hypothetical protein